MNPTVATADPPVEPPEPDPPSVQRLGEVAAAMLRLGCTCFGGPAAHVAVMRDEFVERRRWCSSQEFLDLLGVSGLVPGPTSTELAIHLGMRRAGTPGLWAAGICFITPAVLITSAIAWAYITYGSLPAARGLLLGLQPAVVAVVAVALVSLARTALRSPSLWAMALLGAGAAVAGATELSVLLGLGLAGAFGRRPWKPPPAAAGLWAAPAAGAAALPAVTQPGAADLFWYFLKLGAMLFGSGYVLLSFLQRGLVADLGWASEKLILDAVSVGQFTPGPLFSTAAFVGYVLAGPGGAAAASAGIFLPSFLIVWVTHPVVRRLRSSPWTAGILDGLNAGSVGLMAAVLLPLGKAAAAPGWPAWLILVGAGTALLRFRANSAAVLAAAAGLGILWEWLASP